MGSGCFREGIEINIERNNNMFITYIYPIITAVISSLLLPFFLLNINLKKAQKREFKTELNKILQIAFQNPFLEDFSFTSDWTPDKKSNVKFAQYEIYAIIVFNYLSNVCEFCNYNLKKVNTIIAIKPWVTIHQRYWDYPSTDNENEDEYDKKYVNFINNLLEKK